MSVSILSGFLSLCVNMIKNMELLVTVILCIITFSSTLAQDEQESNNPNDDPVYLYGSFRHVVLPDHWHINYYGMSAEVKSSDMTGLSGSILYGRGSNNTSFIHIPVTGVAACLIVTAFDPNVENLLLLFLEKIQYNHAIKESIFVSPYWSILGADLTAGKNGEEGYSLLSSGIGINAKIIFSKQIILSSDLNLKYFFVTDKEKFESGNQFGLTAGISLGYVFE